MYLEKINGKESNLLRKKLLAYEKREVRQKLDGRILTSVAKTFHKAGIVVPYDLKTDVGYRPLSESESMLSTKLFLLFVLIK